MKFFKMIFYLAFSFCFSVALVFFATENLVYRDLALSTSAWGPFFSVFGVIYAIISGFILVDVLSRYNELNHTVEDELNAVEDIRDFLIYVDGEQKEAIKDIQETLYDYIRSVTDKEWKAMSDTSTTTDSDTSEELYDIMRAINQLRVTNESDSVALKSLIEKVAEVTTLRTKRISLSNERLPPQIKLLMIFMSFVLVVGFIFVNIPNMWLHMYMVGAVTLSIHLLYLIISDLDHPFSGFWNINRSAIEDLEYTKMVVVSEISQQSRPKGDKKGKEEERSDKKKSKK